jgi:phosphatidylserine/phosphatidylglycerophosphate/cardiolipin synthase-like enzyme
MVVDKKVAFVGTYNLHPASRTTASEFVGVLEQTKGDPQGPAAKLAILFQSDIDHLGEEVDDAYVARMRAAFEAEDDSVKGSVTGILALGYDTL